MKQYHDLMRAALSNGVVKSDRTGTGTKSIFGHQMRFNLQKGFPLVTTKKLHLKSIIHELIWFLAGETNVEYLKQNGVSIWDEWADENGELGPIYGYQWRSWPDYPKRIEIAGGAFLQCEAIDQITQVIDQIRNNPDSRRMIVSAWNVADIPKMKLPPCHALFQFYTRELSLSERDSLSPNPTAYRGSLDWSEALRETDQDVVELAHSRFDDQGVPRRALDCQLYQRSH